MVIFMITFKLKKIININKQNKTDKNEAFYFTFFRC